MKKLRERQVSLRMALTMCAAAGAITAVICLISTGWNTNEVGKKLREIDRLVSDKYVGELDADNVADYAAAGYITGLGDKWSSYIPAENYEAYRMSGEGKGCGIGVSVTSTETSIRVTLVYDDSPAAKAGIQKGDYILGAGDLTTEKDGSSAVISAISGKEGTDVTVTVKKADGSAKELTMQRAVVTQKMAWGKMLNDKIGYIRITQFTGVTGEQYQEAFDDLQKQGMEKMIVDLRDNPGGLLNSVCDILRKILPEGLIVYTEDKDGNREEEKCDGKNELRIPLAVLVNESSASASEIFAGAVQDYGIGTIVGTTTYGKGVVQSIRQLSDGSAIKLTVANYYTPKGNNINKTGIKPDIEVSLDTSLLNKNKDEITHDEDNQLQEAIKAVEKEK